MSRKQNASKHTKQYCYMLLIGLWKEGENHEFKEGISLCCMRAAAPHIHPPATAIGDRACTWVVDLVFEFGLIIKDSK